ncbi:MAG: polysaccharide deacetylase family protein [Chloroflexi bacterium]|nr:polysaccharide deacetylase family protein [Chloroflexota bacterium]
MQPSPSLPNRLFGHWLIITLTVVLSVTAALAAIGLYRELSGRSVTVVVVQSHPATPAADAEDAETSPVEHTGDPEADPGEHAAPSAGASPPPGSVASPAGEVAVTALAVEPSPAAEQPSGPEQSAPEQTDPARAPAASPAPIVAASPSPEAVAARVPPTPAPRGAPRAVADAPIVMYHHIGPLPPNPDVFRRDLTVSPATFEKTLDYLAEQEIATVTMADLFEHFAGGAALPKKSVILTFDDGYDDNYLYVFQLLKARQMVGTFFISTDFVERPGYLTWDQITEMNDAGMEIAAHSTNHADFTVIGPNELRRQLVEPKRILEERIGQPVRFLAYPAGKYNAAVMAASRAAGYEAAVTVIHGTRHTPAQAFELRRVRAHGADTPAQITARITLPSWR